MSRVLVVRNCQRAASQYKIPSQRFAGTSNRRLSQDDLKSVSIIGESNDAPNKAACDTRFTDTSRLITDASRPKCWPAKYSFAWTKLSRKRLGFERPGKMNCSLRSSWDSSFIRLRR